jgi:hypothetical protein
LPNHGIVIAEKLSPARPELDRLRSRGDQICNEHRREHAVRLDVPLLPLGDLGEKGVQLRQDLVAVA